MAISQTPATTTMRTVPVRERDRRQRADRRARRRHRRWRRAGRRSGGGASWPAARRSGRTTEFDSDSATRHWVMPANARRIDDAGRPDDADADDQWRNRSTTVRVRDAARVRSAAPRRCRSPSGSRRSMRRWTARTRMRRRRRLRRASDAGDELAHERGVPPHRVKRCSEVFELTERFYQPSARSVRSVSAPSPCGVRADPRRCAGGRVSYPSGWLGSMWTTRPLHCPGHIHPAPSTPRTARWGHGPVRRSQSEGSALRMMRAYELMVIIDGDVDDPKAQSYTKLVVDEIDKAGGSIHGKPDWWGKRAFAYPINKKEAGLLLRRRVRRRRRRPRRARAPAPSRGRCRPPQAASDCPKPRPSAAAWRSRPDRPRRPTTRSHHMAN